MSISIVARVGEIQFLGHYHIKHQHQLHLTQQKFTYSFSQGGDGSTPSVLQFAIRDDNQNTLADVRFPSVSNQRQSVEIKSPTIRNDIVIWNIKEIQ